MDENKIIGFFQCPHDVLEDCRFKDLTANAKYLYVVLCKLQNRYSDKDGWFFRSMRNLKEDTGMCLMTLKRAKKKLIDVEFIDKKRGYLVHTGKRSYDFYRLNGFRFRESD